MNFAMEFDIKVVEKFTVAMKLTVVTKFTMTFAMMLAIQISQYRDLQYPANQP